MLKSFYYRKLQIYIVIVNFMYQVAYVKVPRFLVKHYSKSFCEGTF